MRLMSEDERQNDEEKLINGNHFVELYQATEINANFTNDLTHFASRRLIRSIQRRPLYLLLVSAVTASYRTPKRNCIIVSFLPYFVYFRSSFSPASLLVLPSLCNATNTAVAMNDEKLYPCLV